MTLGWPRTSGAHFQLRCRMFMAMCSRRSGRREGNSDSTHRAIKELLREADFVECVKLGNINNVAMIQGTWRIGWRTSSPARGHRHIWWRGGNGAAHILSNPCNPDTIELHRKSEKSGARSFGAQRTAICRADDLVQRSSAIDAIAGGCVRAVLAEFPRVRFNGRRFATELQSTKALKN